MTEKPKSQDIRWLQRLANYTRALESLTSAVELAKSRALSDLEKQGLIQSFEFTHELGWNVLKDYLVYQGNTSITGPRDATREAFRAGILDDGEGWMEMIVSRNQTSHTYNQNVADEIVTHIVQRYHALFLDLRERMGKLRNKGLA